MTDYATEAMELTREGKLRNMRHRTDPGPTEPHFNGPLVNGSWRGRPPHPDHAVAIADFDAQQYGAQEARNSFGTAVSARVPLQMTTENLINACNNHALAETDPHSFDFAVNFRVLLNGEYQGRWLGNRFGWEFHA